MGKRIPGRSGVPLPTSRGADKSRPLIKELPSDPEAPTIRPRLALADEHTLILHGVQHLLEGAFEIVGCANDGRALLALVREMRPDLVLLGIDLPLLNGIDAARRIRELSPPTKIVFLTMHADRDYVVHAFRAGASGYVLKPSADEELVSALRAVLDGDMYISPRLPAEVRALPFMRRDAPAVTESSLTLREREVLQLVAAGRSAKEIADILHLSVKTVEYHKYRMMKRFGSRNAAELATYAVRNGLLALAAPSRTPKPRSPGDEELGPSHRKQGDV
jgi:DNA-binding NarL/FixJ family response regulator